MKCIPTTLSFFYLESIVIVRGNKWTIFLCIEFGKLIYNFFPPKTKQKIKSTLTNSETFFFWICRKYKRLFGLFFFVENSVANFGNDFCFFFILLVFFYQNSEAAYELDAMKCGTNFYFYVQIHSFGCPFIVQCTPTITFLIYSADNLRG